MGCTSLGTSMLCIDFVSPKLSWLAAVDVSKCKIAVGTRRMAMAARPAHNAPIPATMVLSLMESVFDSN